MNRRLMQISPCTRMLGVVATVLVFAVVVFVAQPPGADVGDLEKVGLSKADPLLASATRGKSDPTITIETGVVVTVSVPFFSEFNFNSEMTVAGPLSESKKLSEAAAMVVLDDLEEKLSAHFEPQLKQMRDRLKWIFDGLQGYLPWWAR